MDAESAVFIVDDDEAILASMKMAVESIGMSAEVFRDAGSFLAAFDVSMAGCLVLDIRMPGMSGTELHAELRRRNIDIPVIYITGHGDIPLAVESMKAGAVGFIEKPFREQVIIDHVQKALAIDRKNRARRRMNRSMRNRKQTLTNRENEIMEMLISGKSNKAISYELHLSQKTVSFHRANILKKMGTESVIALAEKLKGGLCLKPGISCAECPIEKCGDVF